MYGLSKSTSINERLAIWFGHDVHHVCFFYFYNWRYENCKHYRISISNMIFVSDMQVLFKVTYLSILNMYVCSKILNHGLNHALYTPPIAEILCVKNVGAFVY